MKLRDESEACVVKRCLSCENADYLDLAAIRGISSRVVEERVERRP